MTKRFPIGTGVLFLVVLYSLPLFAANGLVGTWSAGTLSIGFRADGGYTWKHSQGSLEGIYRVEGDRLTMTYQGRPTVYRFTIEGSALRLADGAGNVIRLNRQTDWTPTPPAPANPVPPPPGKAPAPAPAGPPTAPGGGGTGAKLAVRNPARFYPAEDGSCRLPLPAGYSVREKIIPGGPFYDAMANQVIQRPDRTVYELCQGAAAFGTVVSLRGGVFPFNRANIQESFTRVVATYLKDEITEDGDYKVTVGPQQDTWNGLNRVRMILKDENGSIKNVIYYLDSFQEDGQPALALSMAVLVPEVAQDYQGLTARLCGDIIVVGYADLFVEDNFIKSQGDAALAMVAGLRVNSLAPNPALQRALVGQWEAVDNPSEHVFLGSKITFTADGRFLKNVNVMNQTQAGYTENGGVYRVYGNILMMQYASGEVSTYPVKRSDTALQIGGRVYTR